MKAKINDVVKVTSLINEDWHHGERGECLGENVTIVGETDGGYEANVFLDGELKSFVFSEDEISSL